MEGLGANDDPFDDQLLGQFSQRGGQFTGINDEVDAEDEDNAINARRDAAVNERETEGQRRRVAIEGERVGVEDELNRMQEAEREKRKQETLAASEVDLAAADEVCQTGII